MYGRFCLLVSLVVLFLVAVRADLDQSSITNGLYTTTGTATDSGGFIQLTPSSTNQAGVALYSAQQTIANGFSTTFSYTSSGCSTPSGADGFTFLVSPLLSITGSLATGNSLAIAGAANVAVVAFDLYNSELRVCSANSITPLSWASSCAVGNITASLKCSGAHTLKIGFSAPSSWQVWIDGISQGNFTKDLTNTLTMVNGMAYVGFTGSTGTYYMRQRVTSWTLTSATNCSVNNGGCSLDATCAVVSGSTQCTCNDGFTGDGYTCTVTSPPVNPPVDVPLAAPVSPPVDVPVAAPVYVAPPVDVPIAQPVSAPMATPVTPPTAVPITPPVSTPINTPVTPPVTLPVPVSPPVSTPTAMPVIIPILECFDDLQNGSFIAYFGYNNTMGEQVSVPVGSMNTFGSPSFIGQPTSFEAGRSDFYPQAAFAYLWDGKTLTWTLTSYRLTLDTSDTSRKCPSFARFTLTFYTERQLTDQEINAISLGLSNTLGISPERVRVLSIKYTPVTRKRDLSVAELEMEIAAANSTQQNEPTPSQAVQTIVEAAKNTTALNQVLDPNGTLNLQVLGVKSAPTGVEQSGSASNATPSNEPTTKTPRGLLTGQLESGADSQTEYIMLLISFAVITFLVSV